MKLRIFIKLFLIGFITTIFRVLLQFTIPPGDQTVLKPSIFVENGSFPLIFLIYATLAYTSIAALSLLFNQKVGGKRISKGLKFSIIYSLVWTVYLFEPLPHCVGANLIQLISYPIIDSLALLLLGLLVGKFLFTNSLESKQSLSNKSFYNILSITVLFTFGRIVQYKLFSIYSTFDQSPYQSILWTLITGIIIGCMFNYLYPTIIAKSPFLESIVFGFILFGVNLFFFNFFIPLVFNSDVPDLFLRTFIDILSVTVGAFIAFRFKRTKIIKGGHKHDFL